MNSNFIKKPGFLFLISPDLGLLKEKVQEIIQNFSLTSWSQKTFWADEPLESEFWNSIATSNLFGPGKIIVVRYADKFPLSFWDEVRPYLLSSSNRLCLPIFFFEKPWTKNSPSFSAKFKKHPLFLAAQKKQWILQIPPLTRQTLAKFVQQKLAKKDISISVSTLQKLVDLLPLDTTACLSELAKLELLALSEGVIKEEHLEVLNIYSEENIFELVNLILNSPFHLQTWKEKKLYEGKEDQIIFPLLSLIQREAKVLWLLRFGEQDKVSLPRYIKQKKMTLANQLRLKDIIYLVDVCLACELKIKQGALQPSEALDYLLSRFEKRK
ncbi:MAG: hypothetical protein Q9M37_09120 [Desulfonauticus sp.]|nr:hypothetical protein [Desulfonauticus sp.]